MIKYAKLINGTIEYAPENKGSIINYNLDVKTMVRDGYKELKETVLPDATRKFHINYTEDSKYIYQQIVYEETAEQAAKREAEQEQKRIGNLTCTKRVFILLLEQLGLNYFEQVEPLIKADKKARLEWELCGELLRSNPLLDIFANKLKITSDQLDTIFKIANKECPLSELR